MVDIFGAAASPLPSWSPGTAYTIFPTASPQHWPWRICPITVQWSPRPSGNARIVQPAGFLLRRLSWRSHRYAHLRTAAGGKGLGISSILERPNPLETYVDVAFRTTRCALSISRSVYSEGAMLAARHYSAIPPSKIALLD